MQKKEETEKSECRYAKASNQWRMIDGRRIKVWCKSRHTYALSQSIHAWPQIKVNSFHSLSSFLPNISNNSMSYVKICFMFVFSSSAFAIHSFSLGFSIRWFTYSNENVIRNWEMNNCVTVDKVAGSRLTAQLICIWRNVCVHGIIQI